MNLQQKEKLEAFFCQQEGLTKVIARIIEQQGVPYLVGGVVRDLVTGDQVKDVDIEVHGLDLEVLQKILQSFGPIRLVGKQFGVLRLDSLDVDWSLPRVDSCGRKPDVTIDPNMTIEQACKRRDVTMNAMAIDLRPLIDQEKTFEIIDPYGGQDDIAHQRLRAVDLRLFNEDPLRFYRVMQFIGRFEMVPDEELTVLCKAADLSEVARERVFEEISKLLLRAQQPSLGFRWLAQIDRLNELFPEIGMLVGVKQRLDYHPEGDVFEHTMQTLDAAAQLDESLIDRAASARCSYERRMHTQEEHVHVLFAKDTERDGVLMRARPVTTKQGRPILHPDAHDVTMQRLLIILGALCHDFGKPGTVDEEGRAIGHEEAGVSLAYDFLRRITDNKWLIAGIKKLVRYHLAPGQLLDQEAGLKAYKRLALKLAPEITVIDLGLVALCDLRGRNNEASVPLDIGQDYIEQFWQHVQDARVDHGPVPPLLKGRDLIGLVEPGPLMGEALKRAYSLQIDEGVTDKEELKRHAMSRS